MFQLPTPMPGQVIRSSFVGSTGDPLAKPPVGAQIPPRKQISDYERTKKQDMTDTARKQTVPVRVWCVFGNFSILSAYSASSERYVGKHIGVRSMVVGVKLLLFSL